MANTMKRCLAAVLVAALLAVQGAAATRANPDQNQQEQRDTQSRNEQNALRVLPVLLANDARLRLTVMILMMQNITYQLLMTQGVEVTSQNRVSLGGLFGGILAPTYSAADFLKMLEVGSVYMAGKDRAAVALKGNLKLEDYRVVVFNGENQYDVTGRPELAQIDPQVLAQFGLIPLAVQLLAHSLTPQQANAVAGLAFSEAASDLTPTQQTDIPALRRLLVGKVYAGANNTLYIVIPPAVVLER